MGLDFECLVFRLRGYFTHCRMNIWNVTLKSLTSKFHGNISIVIRYRVKGKDGNKEWKWCLKDNMEERNLCRLRQSSFSLVHNLQVIKNIDIRSRNWPQSLNPSSHSVRLQQIGSLLSSVSHPIPLIPLLYL